MQKSRRYQWTRFSVEALREAVAVFRAEVKSETNSGETRYLTVEIDGAEWHHDTEEEFFADYRRSEGEAVYAVEQLPCKFRMLATGKTALVNVAAPLRKSIESVFEVIDKHAPACRLPEPPEPPPEPPEPPPEPPPLRVFIGHGRSPLWRDLKDHLQDKQGYTVEAYEVGARAGHAVRDILRDMMRRSSFAVLVMTGEDETSDGGLRARQNVIHEIGLFQGRLGFSRAIVLLEDGTEEFSNIHGVEQIRFGKGNIRETFGEVLATLRREFSER